MYVSMFLGSKNYFEKQLPVLLRVQLCIFVHIFFFQYNLENHSDKPMSGAESLVDLDKQIISNTNY